ncbi:MAG TPA: hypothetical protein VH561_09105 [Micromonosporaceae bacterium]|jgi:hypothetical protein
MATATPNGYIAECYWAGVRAQDVGELDGRVHASIAELGAEAVRYLGSVLVVDDDVVLFLFAGPLASVREVAQRAGVPFGRLLRSTLTWHP